MAVPNARSLIVDLTPPVLLRTAQKVWRRARGIGFHTFEGSYPSLADVPCGKDSYDDDNLAQLIADARFENLKSAGTIKKITDSTGQLILPLVVSQLLAEPLTVLDFGGGAGVGLVSILDHVPNLDLSKFSYVIVETSAMCRAVRDKIGSILKAKLGTSSFVEVVDDIPTSLDGPLAVNVSGAIQYISSYRETLSRLAKGSSINKSVNFVFGEQSFFGLVQSYSSSRRGMSGERG